MPTTARILTRPYRPATYRVNIKGRSVKDIVNTYAGRMCLAALVLVALYVIAWACQHASAIDAMATGRG